MIASLKLVADDKNIHSYDSLLNKVVTQPVEAVYYNIFFLNFNHKTSFYSFVVEDAS